MEDTKTTTLYFRLNTKNKKGGNFYNALIGIDEKDEETMLKIVGAIILSKKQTIDNVIFINENNEEINISLKDIEAIKKLTNVVREKDKTILELQKAYNELKNSLETLRSFITNSNYENKDIQNVAVDMHEIDEMMNDIDQRKAKKLKPKKI